MWHGCADVFLLNFCVASFLTGFKNLQRQNTNSAQAASCDRSVVNFPGTLFPSICVTRISRVALQITNSSYRRRKVSYKSKHWAFKSSNKDSKTPNTWPNRSNAESENVPDSLQIRKNYLQCIKRSLRIHKVSSCCKTAEQLTIFITNFSFRKGCRLLTTCHSSIYLGLKTWKWEEIRGVGAPPGSPNPDPISVKQLSFSTPVFRPGF